MAAGMDQPSTSARLRCGIVPGVQEDACEIIGKGGPALRCSSEGVGQWAAERQNRIELAVPVATGVARVEKFTGLDGLLGRGARRPAAIEFQLDRREVRYHDSGTQPRELVGEAPRLPALAYQVLRPLPETGDAPQS